MNRIASLLLAVLVPCFAYAHTEMLLTDALKKGLVRLDAISTNGEYMGKAVKVVLTNNSAATLDIKINTALILKPDMPNYQQLVLPGGDVVSVSAHAVTDMNMNAFCDNGLKDCPKAGAHYSYYRTGGEELVKVLEYVRGHELYNHLGQAAVWSITNYLWLGNVYDSSMHEESEKLVAYIVGVTHREKPDYYATYADYETPGDRAYIGKARAIFVPFEGVPGGSGSLSVAVYDMAGRQIKNVTDPGMYEVGKQTIMVRVDPDDFAKGKYSVRLMNGDRLMHEKTINVEPWIMFGN